MSWLFSQALAVEYSAARCWVGEPFAQLNLMPTAQRFWRSGKPMDVCRFSRFGLTSRVLTAGHGEAMLTWFREVFLAKTSASPALETASMANGPACGLRWHASFAKLSRGTSSWRTAQRSLLEEYTEFSQTWPNSGSMSNGECWERPTLERLTSDDGSGFLPTPVTLDSGSRFNRSPSEGATLRPTLGAMARYDLWPEATTVATDISREGSDRGDATGPTNVVTTYPTPTVAMCKGSSPGALTRRNGRSRVNDRLDYRIEGAGLAGRLNPTWVEWLMGWPIGWTALEPLEMDRFREWSKQHGDSSQEE